MRLGRIQGVLKFDDGVTMVSVHEPAFRSAAERIDADKLFDARRKFGRRGRAWEQLRN